MTDSIRGAGGAGPIDPNRPIGTLTTNQIMTFLNTASTIEGLEETIQVIENVMRNLSNYAVTEAASDEIYLKESNPFYTVIVKEIHDLIKAGEYLIDLFPPDSHEYKQIEQALDMIRFGTDGPKLADLDHIPKAARTLMELSEKIPAGPGTPDEREDLVRSYQMRFWSKMTTLVTSLQQKWEVSFDKQIALKNNATQAQKDFQRLAIELQNILKKPLDGKNIDSLMQTLKKASSLDWSLLPTGSKDRFFASVMGLKGPNIGGQQATIQQLVTGRFIASKLEEWVKANPTGFFFADATTRVPDRERFPAYFQMFDFIKGELGPLKESGFFDEQLANMLLTPQSTLTQDGFPFTLRNILIDLSPPRFIPLGEMATMRTPMGSYIYLKLDHEIITSPRFLQSFTLNTENITFLDKELQFLDALVRKQTNFIEQYENVPTEILSAYRAAEDVIITLSPEFEQVRLLMDRLNFAIIDSVGDRATITPDDPFYELVASQVTHLREIGLYLYKELPPSYNRQQLIAILEELTTLEKLTTSTPPQPLPMEGLGGVKSFPQMATFFMAASTSLIQSPGWPDPTIPSGVRQFRFWQKFNEMFTELQDYPETILKNAEARLAEIEAAQKALLEIQANEVMESLQTVVNELIDGTPVIDLLDTLQEVFQALDALDLKNMPKDVTDRLNAILFGETDPVTGTRTPGLIDLKGPPNGPNGTSATFPDMLMSAIILREINGWYRENNMPAPATLPGTGSDLRLYTQFYIDGSGNVTGLINDPDKGLVNSITKHFLTWPGFEEKGLLSQFINSNRIEEMINFPITGDPQNGIPILLPGLFMDKDHNGAVIGHILPIQNYNLSSDFPIRNRYRFPPFGAGGIRIVGYVFSPVSGDFFKDKAFRDSVTISNRDIAQQVSKTISTFPRAEDLDDLFKEQERIINFMTDSGIIDDLKRAADVTNNLADTALFNSSLPDVLRTTLLDIVMPLQEAELEKYGQTLYFLNTAVRIYNNISGPTTDFANAPTNYNLSSQINRRFPHQGDPPNDYFEGEAKNVTPLIQAQLTTTTANLNAVNQQITAIDTAIASVEKEYSDGNITAEQKEDLIGNLRSLQQHFIHARSDLGQMHDFLSNIKVERQIVGGKERFILIAPGIPDPRNPNPPPMRNQDVLTRLTQVEQLVINGTPNPAGDDPPSLGGLSTIDSRIRQDTQNYGSTTDQAQLSLQNAMTRIQQMWTIVATMLQLLNQMYMSLARSVKGQ